MKNIFDFFKKPVETKEDWIEVEQLYRWDFYIVFDNGTKQSLTMHDLTEKEIKKMPKWYKDVLDWYENPTAQNIVTFNYPLGSISLDATKIHHIYTTVEKE